MRGRASLSPSSFSLLPNGAEIGPGSSLIFGGRLDWGAAASGAEDSTVLFGTILDQSKIARKTSWKHI